MLSRVQKNMSSGPTGEELQSLGYLLLVMKAVLGAGKTKEEGDSCLAVSVFSGNQIMNRLILASYCILLCGCWLPEFL